MSPDLFSEEIPVVRNKKQFIKLVMLYYVKFLIKQSFVDKEIG